MSLSGRLTGRAATAGDADGLIRIRRGRGDSRPAKADTVRILRRQRNADNIEQFIQITRSTRPWGGASLKADVFCQIVINCPARS
jgi:hypothetical protein